jgi:opacity protein-like surface antigen
MAMCPRYLDVLVAVAAFSLAPGAAQAQDEAQGAERSWPRFYVGGAIGRSHGHAGSLSSLGAPPEILDYFGDTAPDGSGDAWKFAVGFRPLRAVGVELQYLDLGDAEIPSPTGNAIVRTHVDMESSVHATVLAALLFIPLRSQAFDVYGKVGVANVGESLRAHALRTGAPCVPLACNFSADRHETESQPYVGMGVRLDISRSVAFRLEYEAIDRDAGDDGTLVSAGVVWQR